MDHPRNAKQSLDRLSKTDLEDADGRGSKFMPALSTIGTLPSLSDLPPIPHGGHDGDVDVTADIDEYEHFWALELSSGEGRRCDIMYTDCCDDLFSDSFRSGFDDPLLSEFEPEPLDPKKCSIPGGFSRKTVSNEGGNAQKRIWKFVTRSSGDKEESKVLFCKRLLKMVKIKQDEVEDLEEQKRARVSIMTQIAQHADEAQDLFTPNLKGFGRQASAGFSFGCKVSASDGGLNFDHGYSRQVTTSFSTHSKSPTSKHRPVDLSVPDEAVEMDEFAKSPGEGW